jgi:hypothetical protein
VSESSRKFLNLVLKDGARCRHERPRVSFGYTLDILKGAVAFLHEIATVELRDRNLGCQWCETQWTWQLKNVFDAALGSTVVLKCPFCQEEYEDFPKPEILVPNVKELPSDTLFLSNYLMDYVGLRATERVGWSCAN